MAIDEEDITPSKLQNLFERKEGHFLDFKSRKLKPRTLPKHISAFANADGGELVIGVEENGGDLNWAGFTDHEEANGLIAFLDENYGTDGILRYTFLSAENQNGFLLLIEIEKSLKLIKTPDDQIYLRAGAQSIKQETPEKIRRIEIDKGLFKYENTKTQSSEKDIKNTIVIINFVLNVTPTSEPLPWLQKQKLCLEGKTTIAGNILFSDEPQIELPKATIKIYRYKTKDKEGTRETLDFDPIAIEGCAYDMIYAAVKKVKKITESIPIMGAAGLEKISYPDVAIHEVITNSIIHRDYSLGLRLIQIQ